MGYRKNIGHNLFTQALKIIFGVVTGIVVARALGPVRQGYVAYIILIFTLLGNFGHLGITSAAAFHQKRSNVERMVIYSTNMNVLGFLSVFFITVVILLKYFGIIMQDYNWLMVIGGLVMMVSYFFIGHHQAWLTGDERIILNNQIGLISFFVKSGVIVLLWLLGMLTVQSFFFTTVIALLLWFILIQIKLKENYSAGISIPLIKMEFAYGSVSWASALFSYMHYRVDQIMIKNYLGTEDLGIYTIAVTIAELMFLLPNSINIALTGRLFNLPEGDDGKELLARTNRISFSICIGLCLIAIPGSLLIPWVYGADYALATRLMLILLPGILFACIPKVVSPWFFCSGRPKVHLYITLGCLILNIILNMVFIPLWGSQGAAFASSISYILYGIYYLVILKVGDGFSIKEMMLPTHRSCHTAQSET